MEQEQYSHIKFQVKKLLFINLEYYKDVQMKRRLDSWLVRSGLSSWNEYFKLVRTDDHELSRFRDYLTINVSSFFRDIERWEGLRKLLQDDLLKDALKQRPENPGLRIWSAGCSIGAEPYTLAMLLQEISPARRHYILGTDLDRGILKKAQSRGPYNPEEIENLTPSQRREHLDPGGPPYYVKERLTEKVKFAEQDLLLDPFENDFDLIVCRNVVIYFTTETKLMLYRKFNQALRPGGILFVGATEIIPHSLDVGFSGYGISFYKKG